MPRTIDWRYRQILNYLLKIVRSSESGAKLPTVREIHRRFVCSHSTIDKALDQLEQDGYIERHVGRGIFCASRDRRVLAERRKDVLKGGIIMAYPDYISNEYAGLVQSAETHAVRNGYSVVPVKMRIDTRYEYLFEVAASMQDVAGLIVVPSSESIFEEKALAQVRALPFPTVFLRPPDRQRNLVAVCPDYHQSGYEMASHLIGLGHSLIAYVHNEPDSNVSALRFKGIKHAMYDSGMKLKQLLRSRQATRIWGDSGQAAYHGTRSMMRGKSAPTAIIYDSARGGAAGIRALMEMGLRVPANLSLIVEGTETLCDYLFPRLTFTQYDKDDLMDTAFRRIIQPKRFHNQQSVIPFRLKVCESTAAPGQAG